MELSLQRKTEYFSSGVFERSLKLFREQMTGLVSISSSSVFVRTVGSPQTTNKKI